MKFYDINRVLECFLHLWLLLERSTPRRFLLLMLRVASLECGGSSTRRIMRKAFNMHYLCGKPTKTGERTSENGVAFA